MKRIAIVVSLLIISCVFLPTFCLAGKYGFGDLNFGDSKEKVQSYLKGKYAEENVINSEKYIWLHDFELGDKSVEVTFFFDHNDMLYSFQFASDKVGADDFQYKLKDDAMYFNAVFTKRFGKPSKNFTPRFFSIDSNSVSYVSKWNNKEYDIFTGVTSYEFRYYAVANVTSKKMEKALEQHNQKERVKSSQEAADDF